MIDHAILDDRGTASERHVIFQHPIISKQLGDLVLTVNPNNVVWNYGLNTANFPTYGGEVVQILSTYFDDMQIDGEVRSYRDIERIYYWFLNYIQIATQGNHGRGSYDMRPVIFKYPHRGWTFQIYPKQLPNFRYGTDVVVPSYQIVSAVLEPEPALSNLILTDAEFKLQAGDDFDTFGKATAGIGYREDNPFSGPTSQTYKPPSQDDGNKALGDFFTNLIPSWLDKDFKDIEVSSQPPEQFGGKDSKKKKQGKDNKGKSGKSGK